MKEGKFNNFIFSPIYDALTPLEKENRDKLAYNAIKTKFFYGAKRARNICRMYHMRYGYENTRNCHRFIGAKRKE